jgi:hypothetical protein
MFRGDKHNTCIKNTTRGGSGVDATQNKVSFDGLTAP